MVAVLALNDDVDLPAFIESFAEASGVADPAGVVRAIAAAPNVPATFAVERHRHRLSLLVVRCDAPLAALEAVKVADALLVVSPVVGTGADSNMNDDDAMQIGGGGDGSGSAKLGDVHPSEAVKSTLTILRAQGFPPGILCGLVGLDAVAQKKRAATRNAATNAVLKTLQIPSDRMKAAPADTRAERLDVVRLVCEHRGAQPRWRSARAYVLAERAGIEAKLAPAGPVPASGSETVTVTVEGYVRGAPLSANQLIHLPGVGDFPVDRVTSATEPCGVAARRGGDATMGDASGGDVLSVPDPAHCEVAIRENIPDTLAGEQTWPTEEEMAEASAAAEAAKDGVKRKPKGWSDYQAAWIADSDSEGEGSDGDGHEEGDADMDGGGEDGFGAETEMREGGGDVGDESDDDEEWVEQGDGAGECDSEPDEETLRNLDDAQRDSVKRAMLQAAEDEELDFPDEVETPLHLPARERFARYRGLKSFRSSPWDPKEQLPHDYARVFAFENFRRAARRAAENSEENAHGGVPVGAFVRVVVRGVPRAAAEALLRGDGAYVPVSTSAGAAGAGGSVGEGGVGPSWSGWCGGAGPVILSSLMQHECKLTVMHYGVTKSPSYDAPLRSKTALWFHVGFRRERAAPIFSTDGLGDKHKFERFLHARRPSMASVYGPVCYPPAPVLGFKEEVTANGMGVRLALSGSVRKADPDRIILKRIILTGVPFKTHKSKAVVRHMFYNPDDIRWFKPLELWTKYGMRGKIKDAIGTHGHMKCLFNGVIQQRDTICATMYKRVYPKFLAA